ncbi:MAG: hypothetical protein K2J74_04575 [Muribaculaceae bacterium]|nr:hypothetical protein [Muribaculaceae bacterium]
MKNFLFPHECQAIGWLLFLPATAMAILFHIGLWGITDILGSVLNNAMIIAIALGAVFIVCSKEVHEDEMTRAIRLASLLNSLYVYVALLVTSTLVLYGQDYLEFMAVNMVLLPIIYVILFRLEMRRYNKMSEDEE